MTDTQLQKRGASQGKSKTKDFWQLASRAYDAAFKGQWRRAYPLLRELAPQKPDNVSLRRWLAEAELRLGMHADALESWREVLCLQEEPAKLHRKLFRQAFRERVEALAETDPGQAQQLCQQARREFDADLGEREIALIRSILGEEEALSETGFSGKSRASAQIRDKDFGKLPAGLVAGPARKLPHTPNRICWTTRAAVAWAAPRAKEPYVAVESMTGTGRSKHSIRGTPVWMGTLQTSIVVVANEGYSLRPDHEQIHVFAWDESGEPRCDHSREGRVRLAVPSCDKSRLLVLVNPYDQPWAAVLDFRGDVIRKFPLALERGWGAMAPGPDGGWWVSDWTSVSLLDAEGRTRSSFRPPRIKSRIRDFGAVNISVHFDESGRIRFTPGRHSTVQLSDLDRDFALLRIPPTTDRHEIKRAFRECAQKVHPDVNAAPQAKERMQELNLAYERLKSADFEAMEGRQEEGGIRWVTVDDLVSSLVTASDGTWGVVVCRSGKVYLVGETGLRALDIDLPEFAEALCVDTATGVVLGIGEHVFWLAQRNGRAVVLPAEVRLGSVRPWCLPGAGAFAVVREQAPSTMIFIDGLRGSELGRIKFPDPIRDFAARAYSPELLVAAGRSIFSFGFRDLVTRAQDGLRPGRGPGGSPQCLPYRYPTDHSQR